MKTLLSDTGNIPNGNPINLIKVQNCLCICAFDNPDIFFNMFKQYIFQFNVNPLGMKKYLDRLRFRFPVFKLKHFLYIVKTLKLQMI